MRKLILIPIIALAFVAAACGDEAFETRTAEEKANSVIELAVDHCASVGSFVVGTDMVEETADDAIVWCYPPSLLTPQQRDQIKRGTIPPPAYVDG